MRVHKIEKIKDNVYHISEAGLVNMFLINGKERSALIDTGCGIANVRKEIESLTGHPIVVLLTHAHPDHAGGVYEFKDCPIYMNSKDSNLKLWGYENDNSFRRMYIETRGKAIYEDITPLLNAIPYPEPDSSFTFKSIKEADVIDLGDLTLEAVETPSHTAGSVSYLLKEERILFSGDSINNSVILPRDSSSSYKPLQEFLRMVEKILSRSNDFDSLAIGHAGPFAKKEILDDYFCLSKGVLDGSIKPCYEERGFRKGEVARYKSAELWVFCDS